jgi:tetratricopeptide (TPR) repeat protein
MKALSFLLVDDNSVALRELVGILRYLGHKDLQEASTASEAWAMLRIKAFDCVISTWDMPEMSGLALLKIVRNDERFEGLPFFLADSAFTKVKVIEAGRAGTTGLIVKPYDVEAVNDKITGIPEAMGGVPTEGEISLDEGMKLLEGEDYEGALEVFEKLLNEGESAEIYYNIGYIKAAQERYPEAIEAFRKATQFDRLFAKAYEAMGRAYKALGQPEKAEKSLNKAAEIYMSSEKDENAEEILNEILELRPETVNVYNSLGVLYRKKGEYQTALGHYKKALKIHPNEANIHYNIGRIHVDLRDFERAQFYFRSALKLAPGFKDAKEALNAIELGLTRDL